MASAKIGDRKHKTLIRDVRGNLMDAAVALKQLSDRIRISNGLTTDDRAYMFSMVNSALLSIVDSQETIAYMQDLIEKAPNRISAEDKRTH